MIQALENFALVEIEKKFQDDNGGIIVDTTWHPEEYATLEGTVISAPVRTESDLGRTIVGNVKNGDRIFFSYGVIFQYTRQPDDDTPVYANLVFYEGKEYWQVEVGEIFCVVNDDGVRMITDNVLIAPDQPEESYMYVERKDTGKVVGMPKGLSCSIGDTICFESKFVQEYNIFGKVHYIIPSRRVIAKIS